MIKIPPITNELIIHVDPNIKAISVILLVSISINPAPKKKKCQDNDLKPEVKNISIKKVINKIMIRILM
tara:strand:+ start:450 stop:656 length:207 start_codon:yes stop_codon:yes gene_type:complete